MAQQEALKIIGGTLYIKEGDEFRIVGLSDADEPIRRAYRYLFAFLEKFPPDGDYTLSGMAMIPAKDNECFLQYLGKGARIAHRATIRKLERTRR